MPYAGVLLLILLAAPAFSLAATAEQLVLTTHFDNADPEAVAEPLSVTLSSISSGETVTLDVRVGRPTAIDLPSGSHQLTIRSEEYWAPASIVQSPGEAQVNLLPLGRIAFPLPEPQGNSVAERDQVMTLKLEECDRDRSCAIAGETFPCSRLKTRLECPAPVGEYSLSLRTRSYAPVYYFDVSVRGDGATKLPAPKLTPGGSIAGFVSLADAEIDPDQISIELSPLSIKGVDPDEFRRSTVRARVVKPDARGFFQFPRLPAGAYRLSAKHRGFSPYELAPIQVYEGAESSLRKDLELQRPLEVLVTLVPSVSPSGRPWQAEVSRVSDYGLGIARIPGVKAGTGDGALQIDAPGAGDYLLEISDRQTGFVTTVPLSVSAAPVQTHELELGLTEVAGNVLLGQEPVPAELWFGGEHGASSVHVRTDEDGSFTGWLPGRKHWLVEVSSSSFRRTSLNIDLSKTDPKKLKLEIPRNAVFGKVVDEAGHPVTGASVYAARPEGGVVSDETHSDGTFELVHLSGETVTVAARADDGRASRSRSFEIGPDSWVGPITLTLDAQRSIKVKVESAGQAVQGAVVFSYPHGTMSMAQGVTNDAGVAELDLSESGSAMDVYVMAAGFPLFTQSNEATDRISISLPAVGANLTVMFEPDSSVPLLARNGTIIPAEVLFHWMMGQGRMPIGSTEWRLENLAPGTFTTCRLDVSRGVPTVVDGHELLEILPCRQVTLPPGGGAEIDLSTVD